MATRASASNANAMIEATALTAYAGSTTAALTPARSLGMVSMITRRVRTTRAPAAMAIGPAMRASGVSDMSDLLGWPFGLADGRRTAASAPPGGRSSGLAAHRG